MLSLENIAKLRNKLSRNTRILVEGKKDRKALEKLGFGNIVEISGKSNESIVESVESKNTSRVAILTDFDREGEKKYKELKRVFEKTGIKTDFTVRDNFRKIFKIRKIEEAASVAVGVDEYYRGDSHSTTRKALSRRRFMKRRKGRAEGKQV